MNKLAQTINRIMAEKGLKQTDLVTPVLKQSIVSALMRGTRSLKNENQIRELAKKLGVGVEEIKKAIFEDKVSKLYAELDYYPSAGEKETAINRINIYKESEVDGIFTETGFIKSKPDADPMFQIGLGQLHDGTEMFGVYMEEDSLFPRASKGEIVVFSSDKKRKGLVYTLLLYKDEEGKFNSIIGRMSHFPAGIYVMETYHPFTTKILAASDVLQVYKLVLIISPTLI